MLLVCNRAWLCKLPWIKESKMLVSHRKAKEWSVRQARWQVRLSLMQRNLDWNVQLRPWNQIKKGHRRRCTSVLQERLSAQIFLMRKTVSWFLASIGIAIIWTDAPNAEIAKGAHLRAIDIAMRSTNFERYNKITLWNSCEHRMSGDPSWSPACALQWNASHVWWPLVVTSMCSALECITCLVAPRGHQHVLCDFAQHV